MRHVRLHRLGSGQFGEVYAAVGMDMGRYMAIKVLRPLPEAIKMKMRLQVNTLHKIRHARKTQTFNAIPID